MTHMLFGRGANRVQSASARDCRQRRAAARRHSRVFAPARRRNACLNRSRLFVNSTASPMASIRRNQSRRIQLLWAGGRRKPDRHRFPALHRLRHQTCDLVWAGLCGTAKRSGGLVRQPFRLIRRDHSVWPALSGQLQSSHQHRQHDIRRHGERRAQLLRHGE